jgi:hypothetical protein
MGKSSGGSGAVRFPPYLEEAHNKLLTGNDGKNFFEAFNAAWGDSPYSGHTLAMPAVGMLGAGYSIGQFPSLFDMFGKFMAGLDIEVLWTQLYFESVNGPEVDNAINAQSRVLEQDALLHAYPNMEAGMRDINSVHSTAFLTGRAIIESARLTTLNQFGAALRVDMIKIAQARWEKHLSWNQIVMEHYANLQKLFYTAEMDYDQYNLETLAKDKRYNLTLFDDARVAMGLLTGTPAGQAGKEASRASKAIAGTAVGAGVGAYMAAGTSVGGPAGAVIGGVIGLAYGLLS